MTFPRLDDVKLLGIDTETKDPDLKELGPGPRRDGYLIGVSIATKDRGWYFPLKHPDTRNVPEEKFYQWLKSLEDKKFIGANISYDLDYLQYKGFRPKSRILDVQHIEALLDENRRRYNLDSLAEQYLDKHKEETDIERYCNEKGWKGKPQIHLWRMPASVVEPYAIEDARLCLEIFSKQFPKCKEQDLLTVLDIECRLTPLLLQMREHGVRMDETALDTAIIDFQKREHKMKQDLNKLAGREISIWAANDLAHLFDRNGKEYPLTAKTKKPSFTKDFLSKVNWEPAQMIAQVRSMDKMRGTFLEGQMKKMTVNGRIHANIHPLKGTDNGTVSGRFSYSQPNLQFIPARDEILKKLIRGMFLPEEGELWGKTDYSQVELRILAHYARGLKSDELVTMWNKDPMADFHQTCADMVGVDRTTAKRINFGVVYGMGVAKMAIELGIPEEQAQKVLRNYYAKLPFLKKTTKAATRQATKAGFIKTNLHRRSRFDDPKFAYRALNRVVQGTAADVMKKAMVDAYEAGIYDTLSPLITVHDEMDTSVPQTKAGFEALAEQKNIFEKTLRFKVPLIADVEIGPDWGHVEDWVP